MGLFSKLFSGDSKEEKAFWSAYEKAFKSPRQKTLEEMMAALKGTTEHWEGYFLASICYLSGPKDIPINRPNYEEYKLKAMALVQGTEHEDFVNRFYRVTDRDLYSVTKEFDQLKKGYMCVAFGSLAAYTYDQPHIAAHYENDDALYWKAFLNGSFAAGLFNEQDAITSFYSDIAGIKKADVQTIRENTHEFYKRYNASFKKFKKATDRLAKGKSVDWMDISCLAIYLMYYQVFFDGPYMLSKEQNENIVGANALIYLMMKGFGPAVYEVYETAFADQARFNLYNSVLRDFDYTLMCQTEKLMKMGDPTVMTLFSKYQDKLVGATGSDDVDLDIEVSEN